MTKEIIEKLPDLLKNHICTMKKASFDNSRNISMCDSLLTVVDFDKIPKDYARGKRWRCVPNSNDALYISVKGYWYFIEFKNGSIDRADIYRKMYDSMIMLIEMGIIPDFEFCRKNIRYILVYNSEKYGVIPQSEGRDMNFNYILQLSETEERLFGINKLEQYLFYKTHTYSKPLFEQNFLNQMEEEEAIL